MTAQPGPRLSPEQLPVVVCASPFAVGWPDHDKQNIRVDLLPLAEALTRTFESDAHFSPYTTNISRRLKTASIGGPPIEMLYLAADIDDVYGKPKHPNREKRPEWFEQESTKVDRLRERHPGLLQYGTRGGYRLLFACAEPFPITSRKDAAAWSVVYQRFMRYLRTFGIVCDPACKDWTRLFRLPNVCRDSAEKKNVVETWSSPIAGDVHNIEALSW